MVQVSYPGVYIQEIPSGVHTITGVATATPAFAGRAVRGDVNEPVRIASFGDYVRNFGGLSLDSSMSYAVQHFFQNGGADALIVRIYGGGDGVAKTPPGAEGVAAHGTLTIAVNPTDGDKITIDGRDYIFDAAAAVAAQGKLTIAAKPTDGDTMKIGTKTYTFKTAVSVADDIAIGVDEVATRPNIVAALATDPSVTTGAFVGSDLVLTAKIAGTAGNHIVTMSGFMDGGNKFDNGPLGKVRPGSDAGLDNTINGHIAIGSDVAATRANVVAAINRT